MKRTIVIVFISCLFFAACNCTKMTTKVPETSKLSGNWVLTFISDQSIAFDSLYPNKKPNINFDVINQIVNGNSSCNNFTGQLKVEGNQISFAQPMAMTRMACMEGNGEAVFMETLRKITHYTITDEGKTLNFIMGDTVIMRFAKK